MNMSPLTPFIKQLATFLHKTFQVVAISFYNFVEVNFLIISCQWRGWGEEKNMPTINLKLTDKIKCLIYWKSRTYFWKRKKKNLARDHFKMWTQFIIKHQYTSPDLINICFINEQYIFSAAFKFILYLLLFFVK